MGRLGLYPEPHERITFLRGVATLPELRGRGCASALVRSVCAYAATAAAEIPGGGGRYRRVEINVRRDRPAARRLYRRLGFRDFRASHPDYDAAPESRMLVRDLGLPASSSSSSSTSPTSVSAASSSPSASPLSPPPPPPQTADA
jgi:ribosomal protein S18 acetylase RimI-like enzyme